MSFIAHYLNHLIHILFAGFQLRGFHHDPDYRFCSALTQQDPSGVSQALGYLFNLCLYILIILSSCFILNPDIFQNLGLNLHLGCQLI